jgi:hypothetical protein
MAGPAALTARRVVACAASAVLSVGVWRGLRLEEIVVVGWQGDLLEGAIAALPVIAAVAIWSRRVAAQVLARACWWCFLVTGTFIATSSVASESHAGVFSALCAATALLSVGRSGLEGGAGSRFPASRVPRDVCCWPSP